MNNLPSYFFGKGDKKTLQTKIRRMQQLACYPSYPFSFDNEIKRGKIIFIYLEMRKDQKYHTTL